MMGGGAAIRLATWRNAAIALLACTALCPPAALAQTPLQSTNPQPASGAQTLPSADPFPDSNDLSVVEDDVAPPLGTVPVPNPRPQPNESNLSRPASNPGEAVPEPADEAIEPVDMRENTFGTTVDGGENASLDDGQPPGIRIGTLTLRPSVTQSIDFEQKKFPTRSTDRTYLTTGIRGTLSSDWARHQLTVTGEGNIQRNLGGGSAGEEPNANIQSDLRLDLGGGTQANLTAGYAFSREDTNDPNAIAGASVQGGEHVFTTGASIERNIGLLKALAAVDLSRTIYTDAKGVDGRSISLADRDRSGAGLRTRLGYELSPALVPFLEATAGLSDYDQKIDNTGYARSSHSYGAKAGTQINLGEKWRGEVAVGYLRRDYDDSRLSAVNALTMDGNLAWSPQRGTQVDVGLRTTIEDFAGGPRGGWVSRQLTAGLTQQLRSDLVARLTAGLERRSFLTSDIRDETEYTVGAGLVWNINRYLDFTTQVSYETTPVTDTSQWRIGAGLTLRR